MTINEYQQLAQRTANTKAPSSKIENGILGLCGETGEIADAYKKHLYQGHEFERGHMAEELGDVMYTSTLIPCMWLKILQARTQTRITMCSNSIRTGFRMWRCADADVND